MVSVNERVQDFEFEALFENEVKKTKFSDYKGKWLVLLFYPADFTFICPTELEEAAGLNAEFEKNGAQLVSVSTDTVFAHQAWKESSPSVAKINYPMAADPTGKICKAFGTYIEAEGLSVRATFIIDPDGAIKAIEMHDNSIGRNAKEILRKLQAAKFVREHKGKVCPASWIPGGKTLEPSLDLVGKI